MGFDDVAVLELKGWKSDADFNNLFPTGAKSEIRGGYGRFPSGSGQLHQTLSLDFIFSLYNTVDAGFLGHAREMRIIW